MPKWLDTKYDGYGACPCCPSSRRLRRDGRLPAHHASPNYGAIVAERPALTSGMAEIVMDDQGVDYDTAVASLDPKDIDVNAIDYLDGILADEQSTRTTNPSTCAALHTELVLIRRWGHLLR